MTGRGVRSRKEPTPNQLLLHKHEADDVFHKWISLQKQLYNQIPEFPTLKPKMNDARCSVVHTDVLHVHGDIVFVWQLVSHTLHSRVLGQHPLRHLVQRRLTERDYATSDEFPEITLLATTTLVATH